MSFLAEYHEAHKSRRARWTARGRISTDLEVMSPAAIRRARRERERREADIQRAKQLSDELEKIASRWADRAGIGHPMQVEDYAYRAPLRTILLEVAAEHGLSPEDITSASRNLRLIAARFEFYYRAARETDKSYPAIGKFCGGRDHTTIMHGIQSYCLKQGLTVPRGGNTAIARRKDRA